MISLSQGTVKPLAAAQIATDIETLKTARNQGFLSLHLQSQLWRDAESLAKDFRGRFQKLVVCGIGGSSLGFESFQNFFHFDQTIVIDNVETSTIAQRLKNENLHDMAWVFISKTGGTIETLSCLDWMVEFYEHKQISWKNRIAVITENKPSSLKNFATENGLPSLEVPVNVGGRYSVFSPVGLFPLFFCGVTVDQIQAGMSAALKNEQFISHFVAEVLQSFQRQEWITSFWFYSSRCHSLGRWMSQLWAESLSKTVQWDGRPAPRVSTPLWMIGTCDQHSLLQQWMEGARDKMVVFVKLDEAELQLPRIQNPRFPETQLMKNKSLDQLLRVEADATQSALQSQKVSTLEICLRPNSVEDLVEFKMLMMICVGILGERLNINAFNQPGVELGKTIIKKLLSER